MKQLVRSALLAGIAALAVVGTALASNPRSNAMAVALSDGLVAHIAYKGDLAPKVTVERSTPGPGAAWSPATWAPFTLLDRISADMDRQFDAMFQQDRTLDALPGDDTVIVNWASMQDLPVGETRYSYVAASNGRGFCARNVEITSEGPDHKPKVTSSTSGDCAPGTGASSGRQLPAYIA